MISLFITHRNEQSLGHVSDMLACTESYLNRNELNWKRCPILILSTILQSQTEHKRTKPLLERKHNSRSSSSFQAIEEQHLKLETGRKDIEKTGVVSV